MGCHWSSEEAYLFPAIASNTWCAVLMQVSAHTLGALMDGAWLVMATSVLQLRHAVEHLVGVTVSSSPVSNNFDEETFTGSGLRMCPEGCGHAPLEQGHSRDLGVAGVGVGARRRALSGRLGGRGWLLHVEWLPPRRGPPR